MTQATKFAHLYFIAYNILKAENTVLVFKINKTYTELK